jgi:hypothetical protein
LDVRNVTLLHCSERFVLLLFVIIMYPHQAAVHHAVSQHKSHTVVIEHLLLVSVNENTSEQPIRSSGLSTSRRKRPAQKYEIEVNKLLCESM